MCLAIEHVSWTQKPRSGNREWCVCVRGHGVNICSLIKAFVLCHRAHVLWRHNMLHGHNQHCVGIYYVLWPRSMLCKRRTSAVATQRIKIPKSNLPYSALLANERASGQTRPRSGRESNTNNQHTLQHIIITSLQHTLSLTHHTLHAAHHYLHTPRQESQTRPRTHQHFHSHPTKTPPTPITSNT